MIALVKKASALIALLGPARALDPLAGMLSSAVQLEMPSDWVVDPRPVADAVVIGANIEKPFSEFFASATGLPALLRSPDFTTFRYDIRQRRFFAKTGKPNFREVPFFLELLHQLRRPSRFLGARL